MRPIMSGTACGPGRLIVELPKDEKKPAGGGGYEDRY